MAEEVFCECQSAQHTDIGLGSVLIPLLRTAVQRGQRREAGSGSKSLWGAEPRERE